MCTSNKFPGGAAAAGTHRENHDALRYRLNGTHSLPALHEDPGAITRS